MRTDAYTRGKYRHA